MTKGKQVGTAVLMVGSVFVGAVAGMIVGAIYAPVRLYEHLTGKSVEEKDSQRDDEI